MSATNSGDVQRREEQFRGVREAIVGGRDGEEWGGPEEQPANGFHFDHRLDSFLFDLRAALTGGTHCVARMQKLVIAPGREAWVNWQMLSVSNGGLLAYGYNAPPVNPNDPEAVRDLVRWMIANGWSEPPRPGGAGGMSY